MHHLSPTRQQPFLAQLKTRELLVHPEAGKITHHLVVDLAGSGICYKVGDSLGIYPENSSDIVQHMLEALQCKETEKITDTRSGAAFSIGEFLRTKANLSRVTRKLLSLIAEAQPNGFKKDFLTHLLTKDQHSALKTYLEEREVWDTLKEHPESSLSPQEVCAQLSPLLPRFYSIASAQKVVGEEAHLTVSRTQFVSNGHVRHGVATRYLCESVPLGEKTLCVFLQPSQDFTLPTDPAAPIIMVGPGTGIASFRGFMQERLATNAPGKNWLFFGEWKRSHSYYYGDFWDELSNTGTLRLDLAFSREGTQKTYVQHRMLENSKDLFQWLEEGAYFYVCGDAERMAKDVEVALLHIFQQEGKCSEEAARSYLKSLRQQKRYLRDVY